jgi:hypothetical protein
MHLSPCRAQVTLDANKPSTSGVVMTGRSAKVVTAYRRIVKIPNYLISGPQGLKKYDGTLTLMA